MKAVFLILIAGLVISGIVLIFKLISGAFSLMGGFLNLILGIAVIAALIIIVIWMFKYAGKNK